MCHRCWHLLEHTGTPCVQRVRVIAIYVGRGLMISLLACSARVLVIQWIAHYRLFLKHFVKYLTICRVHCPRLRNTLCLSAFSMIGLCRCFLVILVNYHREYKLKTSSDNSSKSPFRYCFFVLAQKILKAFIQNSLDLLNIQKMTISIEELIERFIESLDWHFILPRIQSLHAVSLVFIHQ